MRAAAVTLATLVAGQVQAQNWLQIAFYASTSSCTGTIGSYGYEDVNPSGECTKTGDASSVQITNCSYISEFMTDNCMGASELMATGANQCQTGLLGAV